MYGTNGRTAIVDLNNHTLQNLPNNVGKEVNGFGYRASDDFLYGFDVTNQNLIRIDATGQGTDLGAVTGLTTPAAAGVFGPSGYLYIRSNTNLLTINVDTRTVVATVPITGNSTGFANFWDMGYNPIDHQLYYLANNSKLFRLDPSTGIATLIANTGINNSVYFGAQMSDAKGNLVVIRNDNGRVYYIETATGAWSLVGYANPADTNDGVFCPTEYFPFTDRSDAKLSYGEATHTLALSLYLGTNIDNDPAAIPSTNADADGSDDDGVTTFPTLSVGASSYTIPAANLTGSGAGTLYAWVDFNGNNSFDTNEFASVPFNNGATGPLNFANFGTVMATGVTTARFRLTTDTLTAANFANTASDGEVEDYIITVNSPALINCGTEFSGSGSGYATGGSGIYPNDIFWLDWSCGAVSQFNPGSIVRKSWTLGNGLQINAQISNITATLTSYNTGSESGDQLDNLYSGLNPLGLANLNAGADPSYTITFTTTLNGLGLPTDIVTANAEDTGAANESHTVTTDGMAWQPIEATGALNAQFSNGGKTVFMSEIPTASGGTLLSFSKEVSSVMVSMLTGGKQALAFGVWSNFDYGDLPTGYPASQGHYLRKTASGGSTPTTLTPVSNLTMATLSDTTDYYLGSIKPDADTGDQPSTHSTGDNTTGVNDEDGVTMPTLTPGLTTNLSATVKGSAGYLQGWIDWNGNQSFESIEQVALNLQDNAAGDLNSATGTLTFSITPPVTAVTPTVYARFRWSNSADLDATSAVTTGETEDYALTFNPSGFTIAGKVYHDANVNGVNNNETGLKNITMVLYDKAANTCRSTQTAADGSYRFSSVQSAAADNYLVYEAATASLPQPSICPPVAADPNGYVSTTSNSVTVTVNTASVNGIDLGDVKLPQFTLEHSQTILPGSTTSYPHRFSTPADGSVSFSLAEDADPNQLHWGAVLFVDTNCNAVLEGGEAQFSGSLAVRAGETVCLLAKVLAPANASDGAAHTLNLTSQFSYGDGSLVAAVVEQTLSDVTRTHAGSTSPIAGAGKLKLSKSVWNMTRNIQGNLALPGETLRYTISYENLGNGQLNELIIYDRVPDFTQLVGASQQCGTTPPELSTCTPTVTGVALKWSFVGQLQPGSQGEVFFEVTVN